MSSVFAGDLGKLGLIKKKKRLTNKLQRNNVENEISKQTQECNCS